MSDYKEIDLKQLYWDAGNITALGLLKLIEKRGYKLIEESKPHDE